MIFPIRLTAILFLVLMSVSIINSFTKTCSNYEGFINNFRQYQWKIPNYYGHKNAVKLNPHIPWEHGTKHDEVLLTKCKCENYCYQKVCNEYRKRLKKLKECIKTHPDKNCYNMFEFIV